MSFRDKVVWITGASSGIGEALTYELNRRGAKLILSSRKEEGLLKVKANCNHPENVKVLTLDLEQFEQMEQKVLSAMELWGEVDVLVNNGGLSQRSFTKDTTISVDSRLMKINYLGTVALTKALLPTWLKRKNGHVVTVSSMVGKYGTPKRSSYSATKHALHGFMDSMRAELSDEGIKVQIICPGFVATNVSINALTGDGSAQGTMDEATGGGIAPNIFAQKMADVMESNQDEAYIAGGKEKLGLYLKRFTPALFNRVIKKMKVT
jgi:dehydrogenase/reductase SDR family protein 7B